MDDSASAQVGEQNKVVEEHHLNIHVQIQGDKIMPRWIDPDKMGSSDHYLRVVDEEEGEDKNSIAGVVN